MRAIADLSRLSVVAFVLCFALLVGACKAPEETNATDTQPSAEAPASSALAVATTTVSKDTFTRGMRVSGPVAAVEEMLLGVELSGLRVTSLNVDVGESVKKDQVLLTLDHRTLDANLAQANAALREAQAGAELARTQLRRGEQLAQKKYISAIQLDEMRAANKQGQARVATARAARNAAALQRSFAELRAPDDGIISKRQVQAGQVVGAGMTLMQLVRGGKLEWRAELPSSQLAQIAPGDSVTLQTPSGASVQGIIRAVSPGVDASSRTGTVYADLPNPQGLQLGTYLEGNIYTGQSQSLVVPSSALVMRDGFPSVFTVTADNKAQAIRVEQGLRQGDMVEIRSGLEAGMTIITEGAGFLAEGDSVRVVAATAELEAQP